MIAPARTYSLDRLAAVAQRLPGFRGKMRLAWRVAKALDALRVLPAYSWRLRDGETELELPRLGVQTVQVAVTGAWDASIQRLLAHHLKPNSLVLDIGASLGLWTIPLARAASAQGGHVWAFEPLPENLVYLRRNVQLNDLTEAVTIRAVALGRQRGEVAIVPLEVGGGNAAVEIEGPQGTAVPMERLDDIHRDRPVSFIKIDVEGFELEVLAGARQLLQEDRPVIYGEFGADWLRRRGADLAGFLREMERLDYEFFEIYVERSRWWRAPDRPVVSARTAGDSFVGEVLLMPRH